MDELEDNFHTGRRDMIAAFAELSDLARRAGVPEVDISSIHGQFFDGNSSVKAAFRVVVLLAETRR